MVQDRTAEEKAKDIREQIKETPLKVLSIEAEEGEDKGRTIIKRIVINCVNDRDEELRITHKPKVKRERFQGGLKLTKDDFAVEKSDLSKSLQNIIDDIAKHGSVNVFANYTVWQAYSNEIQGHKPKVRYVQYASIMDKWKIVDKSKEEVEDYKGWLHKFEINVEYPTETIINQKFLDIAIKQGELFRINSTTIKRLD